MTGTANERPQEAFAGELVYTGRGLIAAAAEIPAAQLIKLVEPHLAAP